MRNVVIPQGVEVIGNLAFAFCQELSSVVIPEGVKTIGEKAFAYCGLLNSINIPSTVTTICNKIIFQTAIKRVVVPRGVSFIGKEAFAGVPGIDVIWPKDMPRGNVQGDMVFFYWLD